jgi:hypothetical protein
VERQSEAEAMELALEEERDMREKAEASAESVQGSMDSRGTELREQVTVLEDELQTARIALERSKLGVDLQAKQGEVRAQEMAAHVELLESQAKTARSDVDDLARALEAARLHNAELSATQSAVTDRAESTITDMEESALRSALSEIDTLEREYADLDASAAKRQHELLMRIDTLEQASVTSGTELAETHKFLEMERSLRIAMEAQGEKRDEALLTANRVLAEAAQNMAVHFDSIRSQMSGKGELRIHDDSKRPTDLAPLIGKLEDATESAATEVKALRDLLREEQELHELTKVQSAEEIADLRHTVELLKQDIDALKAAAVERESELRAETDRRIAEVTAEGAEREAALQKTISELGEKIILSAGALEQAKENLAGEQASHEEAMAAAGALEQTLRERLRDLELAFSLPSSTDAAPSDSGDSTGNAELDSKVQDLYGSILKTAKRDKNLAIVQFESLPADAEKPLELLKPIANLYREKQRYAIAYSLYEEVLARDPGNLFAERKLVMTLFDMGRYDEALERLAGPKAKVEAETPPPPPPADQ